MVLTHIKEVSPDVLPQPLGGDAPLYEWTTEELVEFDKLWSTVISSLGVNCLNI